MKTIRPIVIIIILAITLAAVPNAMAQKEPLKTCAQCGKTMKQSQFPSGGSYCNNCVNAKKTCSQCKQSKSVTKFSKNSNICHDCKAKKNASKVCSRCHKSKNKNAFSKNGIFCKDCQKKIAWQSARNKAVSLPDQAINYYYGIGGVSKNVEKAIELFVQSAAKGDVFSLDYLQDICKNENQTGQYDSKLLSCKEMFNTSERVFEGEVTVEEDLIPQYYWTLAMCYIYGIGTQRDRAKAEEVFEYLEGMDPYYRCNVARVYEEGYFGVIDYKKALEMYEIHYDVYSPAKAATFYIEGKGTSKNIPKAIGLLEESIAIGEDWDNPANLAKYILGKLYFDGEDVERDYNKAFKLFKEASESSVDPDCDAMYMLSICYRFGFGTEKNLEKAKYWQAQAEEHGSEDA